MGDKIMILAYAKVCHGEEGNELFLLLTWTGPEKCNEAVVGWC